MRASDAPPLFDTSALTRALADPYAHHVSPHYRQAFLQAYSNVAPRTTTDGYTLSSTYVPSAANRASRQVPTCDQTSAQAHPQTAVKPILNHLTHGSWYQSGNCRCLRHGCPFVGSRNWKKKDDWDADPCLRGKLIAIHGTSLVLNTPEAVDAWIAERKRRFPTEGRVQDKKRKLEEATARGQLSWEDIGAGPRKKYRESSTFAESNIKSTYGRQRGGYRRRGGLMRRAQRRTEKVEDSTSQQPNAEISCVHEECTNSGSISNDDEPPEVASSKVPTMPPRMPRGGVVHHNEVQASREYSQDSAKRVLQPKKPPRNPFASRSELLRNLLLPEIRVTVSNLSQAIRFFVENDFLRDVEQRPGEAQGQMIEVVGSSEIPCSAPAPKEPKTDVGPS